MAWDSTPTFHYLVLLGPQEVAEKLATEEGIRAERWGDRSGRILEEMTLYLSVALFLNCFYLCTPELSSKLPEFQMSAVYPVESGIAQACERCERVAAEACRPSVYWARGHSWDGQVKLTSGCFGWSELGCLVCCVLWGMIWSWCFHCRWSHVNHSQEKGAIYSFNFCGTECSQPSYSFRAH